ncbi:MAG TPA: nucleoside monophosphate kinase [Clostridiaceae bacterium]
MEAVGRKFSVPIEMCLKKVLEEGKGVIILAGPSLCGKGEIGKALCSILSIPTKRYLSMGDILRQTIEEAKINESFKKDLAIKYNISYKISIFDPDYNNKEDIQKARLHEEDVISYLSLKSNNISQFDWLEYCVLNGVLVPDQCTTSVFDALLENSKELQNSIFILDGHPRTVVAAAHMLKTLDKLKIPVIKVFHLFITKEEMKARGLDRNRADDNLDSLKRRYKFYMDHVQPAISLIKNKIGYKNTCLIDANQPVYFNNGELDLESSINNVVLSVLLALGN